MVKTVKRFVLIAIGIFALALAAVGVLLPLVPTTPFVLVAAIAFAKSSERLHQWLLGHNIFGPLIVNWHRYGAISRTAKITSVVSMLVIIGISIAIGASAGIVIVQILVLSASATFIVTRPLPPADSDADAGQ